MIGAVLGRLERFGRFVGFGSEVVLALPGTAWRRPVEVLRQFERVAWGGLPIVAAAGTSVGLVTWLHLRRPLAPFGAEETLPSVLSAAVMVESGPVLASLLVAGRM